MPPLDPRDRRHLAAVVLAVLVASSPALLNGFVWDDLPVIVHGDIIHDVSNVPRFFAHRTLFAASGFAADDADIGVDTYRPLPLVSFVVDAAIGGGSPLPFHLTNLLAHLGCVVLVFFLARRLLRPAHRHLAAVAAAWFGLAPDLAEAHVWISARFDLFVTLFCVGSLLVHRRALTAEGRRRAGLVAASAFLFFAALFCKEVALVALPSFALFPPEPESAGLSLSWRRRLVSLVPHSLLAALYLAIRAWVLSGMRTHRNGDQLIAAAARAPLMLLDGFVELVVPLRVYIRSMRDDYYALGLVLVLSLGAVAVLLMALVFLKRRTVPSFAWSLFFYASTFAPAALIATMLWPGFGRYLYLPFAGLVGGLTSLAARGYDAVAAKHPAALRIARIAVPAYLAVLALRLALFATDFHDERTLWHATTVAQPDRAHGYGWYGATLLEEGEPAAAIAPLRRAVELDPSEPRYLSQLALAHLATGELQPGLDAVATGIGRFSPHAGVFHALGARAVAGARPDLAANHLTACLAEEPVHPDCERAASELAAVLPRE